MSLRAFFRASISATILGVIVLHFAASAATTLPASPVHETASLDDVDANGLYVLSGRADAGAYVLFVHGINGSPRDFRHLVEHLDRSRYQLCLFHYSSNEALDGVARALAAALEELAAHHRVRSVAIVGHSMGGLIARQLIVNDLLPANVAAPLLVTLSTPWEGHAGASVGARFVPSEHAWRDIATGSEYLADLFHGAAGLPKRLPERTQHHLLFSYRKNWMAPGPSGDRVVSVASQLGDSAQEQATRIYGFDVTHVGMLKDAAVASLLVQLLDRTFDTPSVEFAHDSAPE